MDTVEVFLTFRPMSLRKPISIINAITRWISGHPRDHIAFRKEMHVYESTIKKKGGGSGVQKILWDDWVKGRKGTDTIYYTMPAHEIHWGLVNKFRDTKYDTRAAIFHFLKKINHKGKWYKRLLKRKDAAVTCSEFFAIVVGMDDAHKALPRDCEYWLRDKGYPARSMVIN